LGVNSAECQKAVLYAIFCRDLLEFGCQRQLLSTHMCGGSEEKTHTLRGEKRGKANGKWAATRRQVHCSFLPFYGVQKHQRVGFYLVILSLIMHAIRANNSFLPCMVKI